MQKFKIIGYVSLIVSVILTVISIALYQAYAEGNLMLETFFCISSTCFSRADIFCPAFVLGFLTLALGLVLIGEDVYEKLNRLSKLKRAS
tara:strand:- start:1453 stop:1722 length:270 start_codon:yes stop_codon:yes gene_type:complete